MQWQKQCSNSGISLAIDYEAVVRDEGESTEGELIAFLLDELPYVWLDDYLAMTPSLLPDRKFWVERFTN